MIINYGWQPDPIQNKLVFNTGVALASPAGTPVLAVGPGTVAFAGTDSVYGNLVVVNHAQGLQTRYANLATLEVRVGQTLRQGDRLGQIAPRRVPLRRKRPRGMIAIPLYFLRCGSTPPWAGWPKTPKILCRPWCCDS